jgi:hypothetical protein
MLLSDYELTNYLLHLRTLMPDITVSGEVMVAPLEEV